MTDQEPTGYTFLEPYDPDELRELHEAGIEEGDFTGDDDLNPPTDLVELYEVMEWENAVVDAENVERVRDGRPAVPLPHPEVGVPPPNDPGEEHSTPFVTRAGWGARAPKCVSHNVQPEGDTCHYGGPSPWSGVDRSSAARFLATASHSRCPTIMRAWQNFHMDSRGWCDFAYNSAACPHGTRYEGRGKGVRCGAQNSEGNRRSYATVSLIGASDPFTDQNKLALLDEGVRLARLRWGHRDWMSTACPGDPIYNWKKAGFPRPGGAVPTPTPTPTPPPTTGVGYVIPPTVRRGSTGGAVRKVQGLINAHGQRIAIDGIFGPGTDTAVRRFQASRHIVSDGIVGPNTWRKLIET